MTNLDRPSPLPPAPLLTAARRVMRPLVRLMMRSGVTFPVLSDSLRALFVEVAMTEILPDAKSRSDSRVSLLTGVHRKEIRRLRSVSPDEEAAPDVVTLASQVVARWVGSVACCDPAGRPIPLPRVRQETGPSFETLIEAITTDIRPRAVLDGLLEHGVVAVDSDDFVCLNADAFVPRPGGEEQLFYFARNLHDHVAAAVANIGGPGAPRFMDRSVHYDRLTAAQARELEDFARVAAMRALLDVNRKALELTASTSDSTAEARRMNFGVYVFDAPDRAVDGAGA